MGPSSSRMELDRTDFAIIESLQEDVRISLSELGCRIGLSELAVSEHVKRPEEHGIITGYGARIDPSALGFSMTAIIRLRTTHDHIHSFLQYFAQIPNVIDVYRTTGEDCFVVKVVVPSPHDLEEIVDSIARFGAVATSVVLRSEPPKTLGRAIITTSRPIR
jgi:Lrp/AsnC family transcriptional regulator, leucine-responsive regulatory protein